MTRLAARQAAIQRLSSADHALATCIRDRDDHPPAHQTRSGIEAHPKLGERKCHAANGCWLARNPRFDSRCA
jgi:hypothetical protein